MIDKALQRRPTFDELIGLRDTDRTKIKLPNRAFQHFYDSPTYQQLLENARIQENHKEKVQELLSSEPKCGFRKNPCEIDGGIHTVYVKKKREEKFSKLMVTPDICGKPSEARNTIYGGSPNCERAAFVFRKSQEAGQ